jgi:predicted MFS family arabinose efflux permease
MKVLRLQALRPFGTPGFWRIWAGSMFWYSARWMDLFVLQWHVLVLTGSAFQVSLIGFYRMAPLPLFGPIAGLVADRFDRRKVLLFAQAWNGTVSAAIAVLILAGWLALWHLAVLVPALGVGWALDLPSRRAFLYDMMGPRRLMNSLALDNLGMDGAKMLGPLSGGLLWPVIGAGGCFVLLALGYAVNFWIYLGVPPTPRPGGAAASGPPLRRLAEGLSYVWRNPVILAVLAVTAIANFFGFPYQNLVAVIGKQILALGPELTGLLLAAEGMGATFAALVLASRREVRHAGRVFSIGMAVTMAAVLCFAFSPWYIVSFLLLLIAGMGIACFATLQSTLMLLSAPADMRGRAMGTLILAIGIQPLGALQIGALASVVGAPYATALTAAAGLLCLGLVLSKTPALR